MVLLNFINVGTFKCHSKKDFKTALEKLYYWNFIIILDFKLY